MFDEPAIAACMAYVDLNPIRAGLHQTPETSRFMSIIERLKAQRLNVETAQSVESTEEAIELPDAQNPPQEKNLLPLNDREIFG